MKAYCVNDMKQFSSMSCLLVLIEMIQLIGLVITFSTLKLYPFIEASFLHASLVGVERIDPLNQPGDHIPRMGTSFLDAFIYVVE